MGVSLANLGQRPGGVPAVDWDLITMLRLDLEGISALSAFKRDAAGAADPLAAELFDEIDRRLREEVVRLQDLLNERQQTGGLPPDFEMPTGEDDVDD